jgi:hypothetical protein
MVSLVCENPLPLDKYFEIYCSTFLASGSVKVPATRKAQQTALRTDSLIFPCKRQKDPVKLPENRRRLRMKNGPFKKKKRLTFVETLNAYRACVTLEMAVSVPASHPFPDMQHGWGNISRVHR